MNYDLEDKNYDLVEGYVIGIDEADDRLLAMYRVHRETHEKYHLTVCEGGYWITTRKYTFDDVVIIKHRELLNY
ncbi:hypothetical protein N9E52_01750 [Alphaproteobacteria bacterium]|nr:hypothetical protein [Alphaproteobacteria bacterium]